MTKFFGRSRIAVFLKTRGVTLVLVMVYLASAWMIGTSALLLLDRALSPDRISAQQEAVDTATLDQLKALRQRPEDRLPRNVNRDPFVGL